MRLLRAGLIFCVEDGLEIVLKHTRIFRPVTAKVQHVISDSFRLLNIHKL